MASAFPSPTLGPGIPPSLLAWLASGMRADLGPMKAAMAALGHPQLDVPVVLVGGTNGKGSTAAFIAQALGEAGLRVGTFSSPSLGSYAEHIHVNGLVVDQRCLAQLGARLVDTSPEPLTPFEAVTALAFMHFASANVDIAVVEVGMGGRLDATAVADPLMSVLTNVDLDHVAALGPTLRHIATEKVAIARPGRPLITGASAEALAHVRGGCEAMGARLVVVRPEGGDWRGFEHVIVAEGLSWRLGPVRLGLMGAHQVANAAVAARALFELAALGWSIDAACVEAGLAGAQLPGRLCQLRRDVPVYFDGAHNPAGCAALAACVGDVIPEPVHGIFGGFHDKDLSGMLRALAPQLHTLTVVPPPGPRGASLADLLNAAQAAAPGLKPSAAPTVAQALRHADETSAASILVCGSLSLYGPLLEALNLEGDGGR